MNERWKRMRHRIEWFACKLLAALIPRLPRRGCAVAARWLGSLAYRVDGRGRRVALANIEAALGDAFDQRQREEIARASYRGFARTMLDLFWAPALTRENIMRYVEIENLEIVRGIQKAGRSAIFVTVHNSGFEWTTITGGFLDFPITAVAEPFKNQALSAIFDELRSVSGQRVLEQESSMIKMLKHVKRGGFCGMLIDLNLPPNQAATVIEAFGMKMCVTLLHAVLAQRGGAALIPINTETLPDGRCRIIVHPPLDVAPEATAREITQACWDFFEPIIRRHPENWMWAYKHWRFRPRDAAREYPIYANVSSKFEKLMRAEEITPKRLTKPA